MKIIKDLRILNAINKKYGIEFDKDYKYIITCAYKIPYNMEYNGKNYISKYFDGCFNPYVVEI